MSGQHSAVRDAAVVRPMRVILVAAAVLVFLAGFQLTVFPTRTAEWFAWTIDVPMTAVFLGAAYWSSAVLEVAGARAAGWARARLTVWTVLVFTVLTLVITLAHLETFHLGSDQPTSARLVAWGWLAIYAGVPVAMAVGLLLQANSPRTAPEVPRHRLPTILRLLLWGLASVLMGTGVALLLAPESAADVWSWPLTPLTARAVGAWLVGLGWAAVHAVLIDDAGSVRPLGWTGVTFVALQVVALLRHGDAIDWSGLPVVAYVAGLAWIGAVSGWILLLRAAGAAAPGSSR